MSGPRDDTAQRFSDERTQEYDSGIRRMVPEYELLHDLGRALLRAELGDTARVLVAGCGNGMEITGLGETRPGWSFTGGDPSSDMDRHRRRRGGWHAGCK